MGRRSVLFTTVAAFVAPVVLGACGASTSGYAGLSEERARIAAVAVVHRLDPRTSLLVGGASKSFDPKSGRDAWSVWFRNVSGYGSGASSCDVYVWHGGESTTGTCIGYRPSP